VAAVNQSVSRSGHDPQNHEGRERDLANPQPAVYSDLFALEAPTGVTKNDKPAEKKIDISYMEILNKNQYQTAANTFLHS
jgi:hypothetical protein